MLSADEEDYLFCTFSKILLVLDYYRILKFYIYMNILLIFYMLIWNTLNKNETQLENIFGNILCALNGDVARALHTIKITELPLAAALDWTRSRGRAPHEVIMGGIDTDTPGAVMSEQFKIVPNFTSSLSFVEHCPLMVFPWCIMVHIGAQFSISKPLSCCSSGLDCDGFAATWWNWWRIIEETLKINNPPPLPPPLSLQSAPWEQWKTLSGQRKIKNI